MTIQMNYQASFTVKKKNKKTIIYLSSADWAYRALKVMVQFCVFHKKVDYFLSKIY